MRNLFKHTWIRAIIAAVGSTAAFWIVYQALRAIFSEGDKLSEFGAVTAGLLANLWTGAVFNWISTGAFIPGPSAATLQEIHETPESRAADIFIRRPLATILLSIAWLGIWVYVTLLHDSFRGALFDNKAIGVALSENDAMRIFAELGGLLSLGITFPLLAASAFVVGWACSSSLRTSAMLVPAASLLIIAAVVNHGAEVLTTGRPPLYDVLRVILRAPEGQTTSGDIGLMWAITLAVFPVGCLAFALYGRIWAALGFSLRGIVVKKEKLVPLPTVRAREGEANKDIEQSPKEMASQSPQADG